MDNAPNIAKGVKGFALGSVVTVAVADLFRLPIEAYYSGEGLISMLSSGSLFGLVFGALLVFAALLVVALPIWLLYRRLGFVKFWQYAITGMVFGLLLASRVHATNYKTTDSRAWDRGQETIRPVVDAIWFFLYGFLPFTTFWLFVYRHRGKPN